MIYFPVMSRLRVPYPVIVTFLLFWIVSVAIPVYSLEPLWIRVLSGEVAALPVAHLDRVYALTDDRTVTCLSSGGNFLWSRPVRGRRIRYLSVADNGLVQVLSGDGVLTCMSRDGVFLWSMRFNQEPSCAPYRGRDGRTIFLFPTRIVCVTDTGNLLWIVPIEGRSFSAVSESGEGHFLFYNDSGTVLLVSPFGSMLGETVLDGLPVTISPVPSGFTAAYQDGRIEFHDVRSGNTGYRMEKLWVVPGTGKTVTLAEKDGTLYQVCGNGQIVARNVTDGTVLWQSMQSFPVSGTVRIDFSYSRITILSAGGAASFDTRGTLLWIHEIRSLTATPAMGNDGIMYGSVSGWSLAAFRPETRILSRKSSIKTETYGILDLAFPGYSYVNASDQVMSFLERVDQALAQGVVGSSEPMFARWLTDILEGKFNDPFSEKPPDSSSRGRAASLLGRLGSSEYRQVLLEAANGPFDESLAIGVIHGLSCLGADMSGESVQAVASLAKRAGVRRPAVQYAACDAFYILARYSHGSVRDEAVRNLTILSKDPWMMQVQNYARKALEALLQ